MERLQPPYSLMQSDSEKDPTLYVSAEQQLESGHVMARPLFALAFRALSLDERYADYEGALEIPCDEDVAEFTEEVEGVARDYRFDQYTSNDELQEGLREALKTRLSSGLYDPSFSMGKIAELDEHEVNGASEIIQSALQGALHEINRDDALESSEAPAGTTAETTLEDERKLYGGAYL